MKRHKIASSALSLALLFALTVPQHAFAFEKLFYFFNNTYGYDNFKKNYEEVDVIAPQIYTVGYDLKVKKPSNTKLIRESKKKKVDTVPLIVNADFSKILMSDILLNQDAQDDIIEFMIEEADKRGYTGWQFDFENINHLDRDMYSAFVAKTYAALKDEGLEFSVAVIPRSTPFDPNSTNQDWSSGYDFQSIGMNSDFMSIMSYDDPRSVGPVASLPFMKRTLDYMVTQVPAEKISLGIPLYCWKWDDEINMKVQSLTHKLALAEYNKAKKKTRDKGYDEDLGSYWYKYELKGNQYTTWCESEESMKDKFELIEEYDLRGFSAWAIGQEGTWLWRLLKDY